MFPGSGLFEAALAAAHAARANDGTLPDAASPAIRSATIAAPLALQGQEKTQPRLSCLLTPGYPDALRTDRLASLASV